VRGTEEEPCLPGVSDQEQLKNRLLDEALAAYWSFKAGKTGADDLANILRRLINSGVERGPEEKLRAETDIDEIAVPVLITLPSATQSNADAITLCRMIHETEHSFLDDLYSRLSIWWAKRIERRLAIRQYRFELRAARRLR
jgi:hypothetical protein